MQIQFNLPYSAQGYLEALTSGSRVSVISYLSIVNLVEFRLIRLSIIFNMDNLLNVELFSIVLSLETVEILSLIDY